MPENPGYAKNILRVDLSRERIAKEPLRKAYMEKFVGGRGIAVKMLFDEIPARTDPLSRQNKLIFMTGPLAGTPVPGSSRFVLVTKSPLTGIYAYAVAGGGFGSALRQAGYDGVVIEGEADEPKYLLIDEKQATLKDAGWLWGAPTSEASRLIKDAVGHDFNVALIGPAGERLVKFASVITDDKRVAGRAGLGAVLGAKRLKAIAVKGKRRLVVANKAKFFRALKEFQRVVMLHQVFRETGTQAGPIHQQTRGILPTKNWREATFKGAEKISYPILREKFVVRDIGCPACPIKCKKVTLVRDCPYAGALTVGPEYETLYAFGSACLVDVPEVIIAADMLCENLGLDTISAGLTIAWAMECFEEGILDLKDTDGLELNFGNHEAMTEAIKRIAYREGKLGGLLAEGSRESSRRVGKGTERFAMHVKGLEMGGYDPRGARGQGVVFACGPRGGCHHGYGLVALVETLEGTNLQSSGKGMLVRNRGRLRILFDSAMLCSHITRDAPLDVIANLISSTIGLDITAERLRETADRTATIERAFNAREGLTREDDTLPERLLTEPLPSGLYKGQVVTLNELERMKTEFYEAMARDKDTGLPTYARMEALGLLDVADQLVAEGVLPKRMKDD